MPDFLRAYVILQLQALELNPTLLSERSHFPFREGCQVFSFDYDRDEKRYFVNVLFQYENDEETLHVSDVPWQVAENWWGKDGDA
jgi:hypothetical protein